MNINKNYSVSGEASVAATTAKEMNSIPANAHNEVVAGENAKKWYVVEKYDFGAGSTDEQIYPYADKTMALAAIPLHYSQFVDMFNQLGWEVVEGCCEDDHAWLSTNDGDHIEIKVYGYSER